jgi:predicted GIY-YIG superfamily endonuclease
MLCFHVYMLRCADGSYYVGHTEDLELRLDQHASGEVPGYTSARRPVVFVWCTDVPSRDQAYELEMRIKGWVRRKKEALIRGDLAAIHELARGPHRHQRR